MPQAVEGPGPAPVRPPRPSGAICRLVEDIAAVVGPACPRSPWRWEQQPLRWQLAQASRYKAPELNATGVLAGYMVTRRRRFFGAVRISWWRVSMTWRSTTMRRRTPSKRLAVSAACSPHRRPEYATSRISSSRHQTWVRPAAARARAWTALAVGSRLGRRARQAQRLPRPPPRGKDQRTPRRTSWRASSSPSSSPVATMAERHVRR